MAKKVLSAKDRLLCKVLGFIAKMLTSSEESKKEVETLITSIQYADEE